MQGRLVTQSAEQKARAAKMGVEDFERKFTMDEMVAGNVIFSATGVTSGSMLQGVRFNNGTVSTETVVMRSENGTLRWVKAQHKASKFA